MLCSFCKEREAFYTRVFEGVSLCKRCFRKNIQTRVKRTIVKHQMLLRDDHLAVAVSGGKDSLVLLTILNKIEKRFPQVRMTAVTIDEGIEGYRTEAVRLAAEHCERLGVPHMVFSFKEIFGVTTDELVRKERDLTPCSYCGVFRRKALDRAARKIGANKIATGHNLDDEVQTALLNIFHGDVSRMARGEPVLSDPEKRFPARIKPVCEIMEKEIALYAFASGLEFQSLSCPHGDEALRNDIRRMLNRLEEKHPGLKYSSYRSILRLRQMMLPKSGLISLKTCKECGEPAVAELCEACKMLRVLNESGEATMGRRPESRVEAQLISSSPLPSER